MPQLILWKGSKVGRRSSPLFLHIQELNNGRSFIIITYLPARFLPEDKKLTISGGSEPAELTFDDFSAVESFMYKLSQEADYVYINA